MCLCIERNWHHIVACYTQSTDCLFMTDPTPQGKGWDLQNDTRKCTACTKWSYLREHTNKKSLQRKTDLVCPILRFQGLQAKSRQLSTVLCRCRASFLFFFWHTSMLAFNIKKCSKQEQNQSKARVCGIKVVICTFLLPIIDAHLSTLLLSKMLLASSTMC